MTSSECAVEGRQRTPGSACRQDDEIGVGHLPMSVQRGQFERAVADVICPECDLWPVVDRTECGWGNAPVSPSRRRNLTRAPSTTGHSAMWSTVDNQRCAASWKA